MVDAAAAGVLFTANPITGTRTEMVVDAVAGLGDVVVDGSVTADHYVLADHQILNGQSHPATGCLRTAQLEQLREAGDRLQRRADSPQDIEFAFDHDGTLWLLQSRPITTLFPVPESSRPGPRVYFEVGHMQGMLRPFTPMGMSAMRVATAQYFRSIGIPADPFDGHPGMIDVAGRMYLDLTGYVRSTSMRTRLPAFMKLYGPRVSAAMERVLADPRFAPVPGRGSESVALLATPGPPLVTVIVNSASSPAFTATTRTGVPAHASAASSSAASSPRHDGHQLAQKCSTSTASSCGGPSAAGAPSRLWSSSGASAAPVAPSVASINRARTRCTQY